MPAQAVAESFAPSRLPALDRAEGPSQVSGGLLVAAALEIAEDERCRVARGSLSISWWSKPSRSSIFTMCASGRALTARSSWRRLRAAARRARDAVRTAT